MILKDLYLFPDNRQLNIEMDYQTRSLCNYLARQIKTLKYKTEFRRISISCSEAPSQNMGVNTSNVLQIQVPFDLARYRSYTTTAELNEYFIELMVSALDRIQGKYDIPYQSLIDGVESFRENNYKNTWEIKTKLLKEHGVKCVLQGDLTTSEFICTLFFYKKNDIMFQDIVFRSKPDEIFFNGEINKIDIDGDTLLVSNKFEETIYSLDVLAAIK